MRCQTRGYLHDQITISKWYDFEAVVTFILYDDNVRVVSNELQLINISKAAMQGTESINWDEVIEKEYPELHCDIRQERLPIVAGHDVCTRISKHQ